MFPPAWAGSCCRSFGICLNRAWRTCCVRRAPRWRSNRRRGAGTRASATSTGRSVKNVVYGAALAFFPCPLWINGILLARRFSCLFSGSWSREAKPSPDPVFAQGGRLNARPAHCSRYFYPGTHHFGLCFASVSLFAMDGGGGRNDLWTVHYLL